MSQDFLQCLGEHADSFIQICFCLVKFSGQILITYIFNYYNDLYL